MINVEFDRRTLREIENRIGPFTRRTPSAISNAINRAVTNVNSNIKKEVRKEYNIKAKDIQSTLTKTRATKTNLTGEVVSSGDLIALDKFKVSPKTVNPRRKTPIKIGVKKDGLKPVLRAFVTDINGLKVMERKGKPRLPINRLFGPSIPQMIDNDGVREKIIQEGQQMFLNRFDHEINRILGSGIR